MSDSPRRGFTLITLVLALLAVGVAAALAITFLTSPLDEASLSTAGVVDRSAGEAVFAALAAALLSGLVIASLYASWRPSVRVAVRLACAGLITIAGVAAALALDPASASLQARFGVYAHGEGREVLLSFFTPWVERLATLAWLYAACGAALLVLAVVAVLASRGVRSFSAVRSATSHSAD